MKVSLTYVLTFVHLHTDKHIITQKLICETDGKMYTHSCTLHTCHQTQKSHKCASAYTHRHKNTYNYPICDLRAVLQICVDREGQLSDQQLFLSLSVLCSFASVFVLFKYADILLVATSQHVEKLRK